MKQQIVLAAVLASITLVGSASAQTYGPPPCPPVPACPPAQRAYLIPDVTSCYRTTTQPCFNPIQGVGNVLGKIFAPTCYDTCKPCVTCP